MPTPDAVFLARLQFAFTIGFHIVLPAFSIGLASYLAVLEGLWLRTGRQVYPGPVPVLGEGLRAGVRAWASSPASSCPTSSAPTGAQFADKAGPVIGPLMGYEVLTAFFLEAGFLGIMLFGLRKRRAGLHFAATCIVAFGTLISAFWILSANSWMQTPRGYTHRRADGHFVPADWSAIIFNPSFFVRLPHMVLAAYLSVAFFVGAVGAWHLLRDRGNVGGAHHVLDGDVDGHLRGAGADRHGRPARAEHAALPAGQDRRAGRRLGDRARPRR